MTGQYAQKVGMSDYGAQHFTYQNYVTFGDVLKGDVLKTVGYKTLMVSKHHADDNPFKGPVSIALDIAICGNFQILT